MISDNNLKGLVLCGGHSMRMRYDKSNIVYREQPQWQYLVSMLRNFLPEVYISCREAQSFPGWPQLITDSVEGSGPSVGLLSAHARFPEASWLVLACDLPLISRESVAYLLENRRRGKAATAFLSPFNNRPEPLIAIWEKSGLQQLTVDYKNGKGCPRKTLQNVDVAIIDNPYADEQFNANTPEEMLEALAKLR